MSCPLPELSLLQSVSLTERAARHDQRLAAARAGRNEDGRVELRPRPRRRSVYTDDYGPLARVENLRSGRRVRYAAGTRRARGRRAELRERGADRCGCVLGAARRRRAARAPRLEQRGARRGGGGGGRRRVRLVILEGCDVGGILNEHGNWLLAQTAERRWGWMRARLVRAAMREPRRDAVGRGGEHRAAQS